MTLQAELRALEKLLDRLRPPCRESDEEGERLLRMATFDELEALESAFEAGDADTLWESLVETLARREQIARVLQRVPHEEVSANDPLAALTTTEEGDRLLALAGRADWTATETVEVGALVRALAERAEAAWRRHRGLVGRTP